MAGMDKLVACKKCNRDQSMAQLYEILKLREGINLQMAQLQDEVSRLKASLTQQTVENENAKNQLEIMQLRVEMNQPTHLCSCRRHDGGIWGENMSQQGQEPQIPNIPQDLPPMEGRISVGDVVSERGAGVGLV
ncbi:hypothetical protein VP01_2318g4 [Puccinia sorghi]|uniref:Uncharacterized protein n=1 Tax=Puccinia sorghi TaxID=27349 RepID=A0A0L6V7T1_9BASI|nr:hypothetical protein VP01_2318g4 [Puccinia sorghi]